MDVSTGGEGKLDPFVKDRMPVGVFCLGESEDRDAASEMGVLDRLAEDELPNKGKEPGIVPY